MKIIKRDGTYEDLSFDKILYRLKKLCNDKSLGVLSTIDSDLIAQKTVSSIYDGISSSELDEEAARIAIGMIENIEYAKLASRIIISNIQKNTLSSFSTIMQMLYNNIDNTGKHAPIITNEMNTIVQKHKEIFDTSIDYSRDYLFDYFGYKTFEKSYLLRLEKKVVERPQHLYMRVAIQVHKDDIENVLKTYNLISQHYFTFASPTLFNSMSHLNNLSSCFHEDTLVNTVNEGPKKIKDVQIGDTVITHLGNVKKVVQLHKNHLNSRKLYYLSLYNTPFIKVTDNHNIWCMSSNDNYKNPKWIAVEDLKDGDYVCIPNTKSHEYSSYELVNCYTVLKNILMSESKEIELPSCFYLFDKNMMLLLLQSFDKNLLSKVISKCDIYKLRDKGIPILTSIQFYTLANVLSLLNDLNENSNIKLYKEFTFIKFNNKIELIDDLPEYVYTLGIEDDHSYNVGGIIAQNCFLLGTEDSVDGMYKTIADCARISKVGGGIGLHVSNIRAKGSIIRGTNGISDGIIPMLKVYNEVSVHINQSGRRKGSFAIYLTPDHPDILEFLDLRKGQGSEQMRARDLFLAMWLSDLFMEQVQKNGDWYLMCPDECPGLNDVYGDDYKKLYYSYVEKKMYRSKIKAQDVWVKILDSQMETGTPYMLYKDSINNKSNQKNIGVIKSSNLCVDGETMILTSEGYYRISSLENKRINIWNGREFTKTVVKKTGNNQAMMTIMFSNGCRLTCTPYHKFYNDKGRKIDASNLKIGTQLIKYELPIVSNPQILHDSFNVGKQMSLMCQIDNANEQITEDSLSEMIKEIIVPINFTVKSKIFWLNGLLTEGLGFVNETLNKKVITIHSLYITFLENTLLLLQTLSCHPVIIQNANHNYYSLIINDTDIKILIQNGFVFSNEYICLSDVEFKTYYYPKNENVYVVDIVPNDKVADTYCFKEPNRGMGIFNGVLTGNCSEITLYSDDKEYAVCNLASVALPKYVEYDPDGKPYFNHQLLYEVSKNIVLPMNNVIDYNYYPTPETKLSNMRHRPIGVGVQGLADVYIKMRFPFESAEAKQLNKEIFETLYYGTLTGSMELSKKVGFYSTFEGSPFSEGKLQFDLWKEYDNINLNEYISGRWDWNSLKEDIKKYGVRNSTLLTCMPTASSAQIMGNSDTMEPIDSCIYKKRVLSGEYIIANKYLVNELTSLGLWNKQMKDLIIANNGSIQNINSIPDKTKALYKTVWEMSMKNIIDQSLDRSIFIDQTQSLNLFMQQPNYKKLTSMHFYAWSKKLKTGMYYLRQVSKVSAGKFSVDPELEKKLRELYVSKQTTPPIVEDCEMCSA